MKITLPQVFSDNPSQPAVADGGILVAKNPSRESVNITLLGGGPFYFRCSNNSTTKKASSTTWRFSTGTTLGTVVTISDFKGDITVSPAVTAGQLNVCENSSHV